MTFARRPFTVIVITGHHAGWRIASFSVCGFGDVNCEPRGVGVRETRRLRDRDAAFAPVERRGDEQVHVQVSSPLCA